MKNNLKKIRLEKGLTQEKLCCELRKQGYYIDRTTYSKYETGSRSMSCEALIEFACFFGTSCDYILGI
ncbi:MAG: helix-turn-helix transcriptional regulator [Clostridia bacterium]|nr:helix-turn-helix transcriptional regulator [Clostridia bacterium]